ncbi:MAG: M67 family metallopeptidase [Salinisphaeraceae bacterium]|nr:M67 family metallopeptidase [Salinisphaeraceae bacterium]
MTELLTLPRNLVQQLFHHAQSKPENEVCGLLSQGDNGQLRSHRIANVAEDPQQAFLMEDAQLVKAMQAIREAGEKLFAIYHSHPSAPAVPSAKDLAEAGYPEAWHLIISLNTKGVLELRCWRLVNNEAQETPLRIIED